MAPDHTAAALQRLLPQLRNRFGDRLSQVEAVREQHSHGEGVPDAGLPDAVAFPIDNDEVAFVARSCFDADVPMVPFGTGTSLEAHVAAVHGGLCVDLSRMDK